MSKRVCKYYATPKGCSLGEECPFLHSVPLPSQPIETPPQPIQLVYSTPSSAVVMGKPAKTKEKNQRMCIYVARGQECPRGATCAFSHVTPTTVPVSAPVPDLPSGDPQPQPRAPKAPRGKKQQQQSSKEAIPAVTLSATTTTTASAVSTLPPPPPPTTARPSLSQPVVSSDAKQQREPVTRGPRKTGVFLVR